MSPRTLPFQTNPRANDFRGVAQPGLARLLGVQEVESSNFSTPTETIYGDAVSHLHHGFASKRGR